MAAAMTQAMSSAELLAFAGRLSRPSALVELGVLVACLLLALLVVRLLRGAKPTPGSVWFGERLLDGVLFPVLALALSFGAQSALQLWLPITVFHLAIPLLLSLMAIRLAVRVLHAAFPTSSWASVIERTVSWFAWGGAALWMTGLLPLVLEELDRITIGAGKTHVSLRNLVEGSLTAAVVLVLALWVSAAIERRLLHGTGDDLSLRKMAANIVRVLLLFVGLLLAMSAVGIDLTALSVLGGAVGVGLGFGLKNLAANYVSGFVILAERSLRIGDVVKVDTFEGRITDIKTRYTVIRALSGREAIVPNELLITQRIENSSLADRKVLLSTVVQVAYGTDLDRLCPVLTEAVGRVPRVLDDPGPSVHLTNFAADGLELTVWFWIGDPESGTSSVRSGVNLAILATLNAAGVEIPYPQRVLHVTPESARQLADSPAAESARGERIGLPG